MKIGILGSGSVAQTIGAALVGLGHDIKLGTRDPSKLEAWRAGKGRGGSVGSFADAAAHGELVFNCTAGTGSLNALALAGAENLSGKILIDVANPLDFSQGFPPYLTVCNTDSLGEQIQRAFPAVKVVKTLQTVTAAIMVNPRMLSQETDLFISGNDADAKAFVADFLKQSFGWTSIIDLGDITTARGPEMLLPIWVRLYGPLGTGLFNFKIVT
jgi:predicted dinucleotide-binding enzyme